MRTEKYGDWLIKDLKVPVIDRTSIAATYFDPELEFPPVSIEYKVVCVWRGDPFPTVGDFLDVVHRAIEVFGAKYEEIFIENPFPQTGDRVFGVTLV